MFDKAVDQFTFVNFGIFFSFGKFYKNLSYNQIVLIAIGIQILKHVLISMNETKNLLVEYWPVPQKYWGESILNRIVDVVVMIVAYQYGKTGNFDHLLPKDLNKLMPF